MVLVDDGGAMLGVGARDGRCNELRMPKGKKASTSPISKPTRRAAVTTRKRVDCVVMVVLCLMWRCALEKGRGETAEDKLFLFVWVF